MTKPRVIVDTDPGVDDAVAILLALAAPEIELLGVCVVAGNVPLNDAVQNACKIVSLSGRRDIAVRAGAASPLVRDQVFGKYKTIGSFGDDLVESASLVPDAEHAVRYLVREARAAALSGRLLTLCALGPMTNIALALAQSSDVARGIGRIVCMGGAFTTLGHRTPWAEFNFYADPHAAEIVFNSAIPVTLMPLDVTCQALFTDADIGLVAKNGGRPGRALANLLTCADRSDIQRYGRPGAPIHDAMPLAWLIEPSLFHGRPVAVGVEVTGYTKGHSYADYRGQTGRPANTTLVTGVDEAGFREFVIGRIAAYGGRTDHHAVE